MRLAFDIETDGIEATKVHCVCVKDIDVGHTMRFGPQEVEDALGKLGRAVVLIGHNISGYDLPVLRRLFPGFDPRAVVRDTMVLARLYLPDPVLKERDLAVAKKHPDLLPRDLIGNHNLKAWGYRIGVLKGDFKQEGRDWSTFSQEMLDYCAQDVEVSAALYKFLESKGMSEESIELESAFAPLCSQISRNGFWFDIKAAEALRHQLMRKRAELEDKAKAVWGGWEIPYVTPKKQLPKVKKVEFNPTSRQHIAKYLQEEKGWKPEAFTPEGRAQVDEKVLSRLPWDEAKLFGELFLIDKRLGYLAEGKHSLIHYYRKETGRIHARVIHNGTVTGRCAHTSPNLGQVPRVGNPFGVEFRSLFGVPAGSLLVGADASGLELRCLAHYMAAHDGGEYVRALLESDIHTVNQQAAGLATRDQSKTMIYAFLYGAGDEKMGTIVGGGAKEGKQIKRKLLKNLPALKKVRDAVQQEAQSGWIKGLDGRRLRIRSEHSALNTLLQSAGALVMKRAPLLLMQECEEKWPGQVKLVAHVHDEVQLEVATPNLGDEIGKAAVLSIRRAGESFGLRCPLDGAYRVGSTWFGTH